MGRFLGQTTREPTRGDNILDRLFVSSPTAYSTVRVVKSTVLSDHKAIVTITVTSRDPDFVTPDIKAMLRRKNRLMRAGRVEEAGALTERIGKAVTRRSKKRLCRIDRQHGAKAMWEALRQMTGRRQNVSVVDGVSADSLM